MRKNGDDYLLIDSVSYGDWNPIVILKEAASAGDSWEFTQIIKNSGFTTTSEYTFSIFEKKSTLTINGVVYNDILVIDLDLDIYMEGSYIGSVNHSRYYYAKGVGLISSQIIGAENTNLKTYKVN